MSAELIDRCEICGEYDLVPIQVGICTTCAKKAHKTRAGIEAEGGRLVVACGCFIQFTAEYLSTAEGQLYYSEMLDVALHEMRERKTRHAGEA